MHIYSSLIITRILLGVVILLLGLLSMGLFGFEPPLAEPDGQQFLTALHEAGYFSPIITAIFLVSGVTTIIDRFGALGTIALTPISINILLFHLLLGGGNTPVAIILSGINAYCLWYYWKAYEPLLRPRTNSKNGASGT